MSEITVLENPIKEDFKKNLKESKKILYLASPFITDFAIRLIDENLVSQIGDKKLLTRFDPKNITSFNLPVLKKFLNYGFKIRFNNDIHLKLYIFDNMAMVGSANLTKGGFIDNTELTIAYSEKIKETKIMFSRIWKQSQVINHSTINNNLDLYKLTKNIDKAKKNRKKPIIKYQKINIRGKLNSERIIEDILATNNNYANYQSNSILQANKRRNEVKNVLKSQGFKTSIFYLPPNHKNRDKNDTVFYDIIYGDESYLAGTGLFEYQIKEVFQNKKFKDIITFIYPPMLNQLEWNFLDDNSMWEFCNGLFSFKLKQYSETIPTRLASYFYPEVFLPIFRLGDLKEVSEILGYNGLNITKAEKLFSCTKYITNAMKNYSYNNYIKSNIAYKLLYAVKLYNKLKEGKSFDDIINEIEEEWVKQMYRDGLKTMKNLSVV